MKQKLIDSLRLSETKDIDDLDDPAATEIHSQIIRRKTFLNRVYINFYKRFKHALGELKGDEVIVELGSGGGFIKEILPQVITSDILQVSTVDVCFSGQSISMKDNSVDAFLMTDVFHHVKDPESFLKEMQRALKPGGKIIMVEPANTVWGRFIYQHFHSEQFNPESGWFIEGEGPMSDANGALPWIIFKRDQEIFYQKFPSLKITKFYTHTPLQYLVSGGLSMKQMLPDFCFVLIQVIEFICIPLNRWLGMFYCIEIEKS